MLADEVKLFDEVCGGARRYVEWGSGSSTDYVCKKYLLDYMVTVDTFANILRNLTANLHVRQMLKRKKLQVIHANVGTVGSWGWPKTPAIDVASMWQDVCKRLPKSADTVLVDGRYRNPAACFLSPSGRRLPSYFMISQIDTIIMGC